MNISVGTYNQVDLDDIAEFLLSVKSGKSEQPAEEICSTRNQLRQTFSEKPIRFVIARNKGMLLGCLALLIKHPVTVEIMPHHLWQDGYPLVRPGYDATTITTKLIEAAARWAGQGKYECIELGVEPSDGQDELGTLKTWYESLGFHVRQENVNLMCKLTAQTIPELAVPKGFRLRPITDVDSDDVFRCYHASFSRGHSPFFFDQSERERRAYFETFGVTYGMDEETSLALMKEERVAGFSYTMPWATSYHYVDWLGIHPAYRRRGLGRFLLRYIMKKAIDQGRESAFLSCGLQNLPARALYRQLGWEEIGQDIRYALKVHSQ